MIVSTHKTQAAALTAARKFATEREMSMGGCGRYGNEAGDIVYVQGTNVSSRNARFFVRYVTN